MSCALCKQPLSAADAQNYTACDQCYEAIDCCSSCSARGGLCQACTPAEESINTFTSCDMCDTDEESTNYVIASCDMCSKTMDICFGCSNHRVLCAKCTGHEKHHTTRQ